MPLLERRLSIVHSDPGSPDYRLVHRRAVRLRGVLETILSKRGNNVYHKLGEIAVPVEAAQRAGFTLLIRALPACGQQLLVADETALPLIRAGRAIHQIPYSCLGILNSGTTGMLALDADGNFQHHSYNFQDGTELRHPVNFGVNEHGEATIIDDSKRGTWLAADREYTVSIPLQREAVRVMRTQ